MRWVLAVMLCIGCKEDLGGLCDDADDCKSGLFCAQIGELKGTCTASCAEQPSYCRMRFGANASCLDGYCASKDPGAAADPCGGRCSPNTMKCRLDPPPPTCVPK